MKAMSVRPLRLLGPTSSAHPADMASRGRPSVRMDIGTVLGRPLATIDALRARTLRIVAPLAPRLIRDRERRVAVYGLVAIAFAFAATFAAPMLLLAVGPVVLGVPHLVADLRYLVARPGLYRRAGFWLFVVTPACLAFAYPRAWVSMASVAGAAAVARAPLQRRVLVALAGAALVIVCSRVGRVADLVLAHAHNAIAVALFCVWSRRSTNLHWVVVLGFVLGVVAIALGAFDGGPWSRLSESAIYDVDTLVGTVAPFSDPALSARAVLAFAFAQSVHYAVWVRLVPEADRARPGLRSFSSSLRALAADLGTLSVAVAGLVTIALLAWACIALGAARDGYLRLAIFHGPLEVGAATLLLLERSHLGAYDAASTGTSASPRHAQPGKT